MSKSLLYVFSENRELVSFLSVMLEKLDVSVETCSDEKDLFELCGNAVPNILLVDGKGMEQKNILDMLGNYLAYYKKNITNIFLISDSEDTRRSRVTYTLNGVDYFFEYPANMLEIIARISATIQYQRRLRTIISYERNATVIDTMESISDYLSEHVREPIQSFIDTDIATIEEKKRTAFMRMIRSRACEVLAAIHAVRDEVNKIVASQGGMHSPFKELDDLFKKNLSIVTAAYGVSEE